MMMPIVGFALSLCYFLSMAYLLVTKYRRVRDPGLLWLGAAIVVLPLMTTVLFWPLSSLATEAQLGDGTDMFPFSIVSDGERTAAEFMASFTGLSRLLSAVLLLIAVIFLYRAPKETQRDVTPSEQSAA